MLKFVLAVCLLHVAFGWGEWEDKMADHEKRDSKPMDWMADHEKKDGKPMDWMAMMKGMDGGHDKGDHSKCQHDMAPRGGEDKDQEMMMHFQYMMMKKKKDEEKKAEFMKFMHKFKEMKEKKEWEDKEKAMELFQKHQMLKEKTNQLEEVESMMKSFIEKKHHFVFTLTSNFLKLCKCSDVTAQMTRFFKMGNESTDMIEDMVNPDAIAAMETGDNVELAKIIMKMSHAEQKTIFFKGLIKSMCAGAKTFVQFTKHFEETFMHGHNGTTTSMP